MAKSTGALALLQGYSDDDSDLESESQPAPGVSNNVGSANDVKDEGETQDNNALEAIDVGCRTSGPVSEETDMHLNSAQENNLLKIEVDDVIAPEAEAVLQVENRTQYRKMAENSSSDSDSTDSDSEIVEKEGSLAVEEVHNVSEDEQETDTGNCKTKYNPKPRTIAEDLGLDDLPPLQDLQITVREEECIPIGSVSKLIQQIVLVTANKGTPAVDLESVLFLDRGHTVLGRVLDVIGPVNEPVYIIRFNSAEAIQEKGITEGMSVYYAPRTPHTTFVFLDQLLKMKGSDASWENDVEPPQEHLDYSDDEQERSAKQALRNAKKAAALQQQDGTAPEARPKKKPARRAPRPAPNQVNPAPTHPPNPFYLRQPTPPCYPAYGPQYPGYHPAGHYMPPPVGAVPGMPMQGYPQGPAYPYMGPPHSWTGWGAPQYRPMPPSSTSSAYPHWYPPPPTGPPSGEK